MTAKPKHISPAPLELLAERNEQLEREVERLHAMLDTIHRMSASGNRGQVPADETALCPCDERAALNNADRPAAKTDEPRCKRRGAAKGTHPTKYCAFGDFS